MIEDTNHLPIDFSVRVKYYKNITGKNVKLNVVSDLTIRIGELHLLTVQ